MRDQSKSGRGKREQKMIVRLGNVESRRPQRKAASIYAFQKLHKRPDLEQFAHASLRAPQIERLAFMQAIEGGEQWGIGTQQHLVHLLHYQASGIADILQPGFRTHLSR